jgi:hypothetical protein
MLQTIEEVKKAEIPAVGVINGVDSPNLLSVDSTEPLKTELDQVQEEEKEEGSEDAGTKTKEETTPESKKEEPKEQANKEEEESKEQHKDKVKTSAEERIGNLTKKWRSAERERDFEKARNAELQEELRKVKTQVPTADRPVREDFDDEDEYIEALADWKVEAKFQEKFAQTANEKQVNEQKQVSAAVQTAMDEITEEGRLKYGDFDEVVFAKDLAMTQTMVDIIVESDIAEELFYFLGKNPDVAFDLSELSPVKAAREIGKMEEKVAATIPNPSKFSLGGEDPDNKESRKKVAVKKLTKTPEPIAPVKSTGAIEKDPNSMTTAEYRAWREKK